MSGVVDRVIYVLRPERLQQNQLVVVSLLPVVFVARIDERRDDPALLYARALRTLLHGFWLRQVKQLRVKSKLSKLLFHSPLVARVRLGQIRVLLPKLQKIIYIALISFLLLRETVVLRSLRG